MRKPRSNWLPYDTWYAVEFCRELADKLRRSEEYQAVRIGSYLTDEGKRYAKVFVLPKVEALQT